MKVVQNEKRKKLLGFSFYVNIGNFEAFLRNLNLSTNHLCILEVCSIMKKFFFDLKLNCILKMCLDSQDIRKSEKVETTEFYSQRQSNIIKSYYPRV